MIPALRLLAATAVLSASFTGCAKKDAHVGHDHAPAATTAKHAHTAPHGGALVEVGEHAYNLEIVRDAATGRLSVYVLDGHAENFVRLAAPSLTLTATVAGAKQSLTLVAVANPATGEKGGDTSQFEAQADWLKTTATFDAVLAPFEIRGTTFPAVAFHFPKGNDHD